MDHHPPVVADHVLGIDRGHAAPVHECLDAPGPEVLFTVLNVRQPFDDFGLKRWCAVPFPQGEQAMPIAWDEQVQQAADLLREGLLLVQVVERLLQCARDGLEFLARKGLHFCDSVLCEFFDGYSDDVCGGFSFLIERCWPTSPVPSVRG